MNLKQIYKKATLLPTQKMYLYHETALECKMSYPLPCPMSVHSSLAYSPGRALLRWSVCPSASLPPQPTQLLPQLLTANRPLLA